MKKICMPILLVFMLLTALPLVAAEAPTMSKEELKPLLGSENLVLLDARSGRDWSSSEFIITGARRAAAKDFDTWSKTLPRDGKIVLYCA